LNKGVTLTAGSGGTTVLTTGVISGANNVTVLATGGTVTLSGANTFGGSGKTVAINSGTVKLGNAVGLGNAANAVSITSGAVLDLNGQTVTATNPLTINGTGISSGGVLINSSAAAATYSGLMMLGSVSSIVGPAAEISCSPIPAR